jgi:hypothetical protein
MATAWSHAERNPLRASPTEDPAITVFLADDNLLVREDVRALLALEPDLKVIGTAAGPTPGFFRCGLRRFLRDGGHLPGGVSAQKGWP